MVWAGLEARITAYLLPAAHVPHLQPRSMFAHSVISSHVRPHMKHPRARQQRALGDAQRRTCMVHTGYPGAHG
eukprot:1175921-Prorocentrum_minimum.AAC.1